MRKYFMPAGIFVAALAGASLGATATEAKQCPAGQMFRVKLNVCAPRADNLKFLHHASRPRPASASLARKAVPVPPIAAPDAEASNILRYVPEAFAVQPVAPEPATVPVEGASESEFTTHAPSPYGALKLEAF